MSFAIGPQSALLSAETDEHAAATQKAAVTAAEALATAEAMVIAASAAATEAVARAGHTAAAAIQIRLDADASGRLVGDAPLAASPLPAPALGLGLGLGLDHPIDLGTGGRNRLRRDLTTPSSHAAKTEYLLADASGREDAPYTAAHGYALLAIAEELAVLNLQLASRDARRLR